MSSTTIISSGGTGAVARYDPVPVIIEQTVVPWAEPNTMTLTMAKYVLDSTGLAQGAVTGLTVGGLYGQYFSGDWRGTISTGNIGTLPLSAPTLFTSISYGSRGDYYGFIAIGYFIPPTTGTYNFWTSSDDGSGVWIGDIASASSGRTAANAVVNNSLGAGQGDTKRGGSVSLTAGQVYAIRIVHEEGAGGDNLTFSWSGPGISETTSLSQYFYYFGNGTNFAASISTVGYTELNNVSVAYVSPSAPTIQIPTLYSINSLYNTTYQTFDRQYATITSVNDTVPYNMEALRVKDSTVTMREFRASRIIDSAVAAGGGGNVVVSPADRQVWY